MSYVENLFGVKNKIAVLTGGGGVLAGAIAEGLAQAGAKVVLLGRHIENIQARANSIKQKGGEALPIVADVLDIESLKAANEQIIKQWGVVDILINLAGGNMPGATISPDQTFFDLQPEDLQKVMDLNFNGTVYPSMVFGENMAKRKEGCIINISSMAAYRAITRVVGYSAAKASVSNFTRWLATEMASKFGDGIRVNAIAPGFFVADQNRKLLVNEDGSYTSRGQSVINQTPMRRFGEPDELVGAVIYLSSQASKFVNGAIIPVDGGFEVFSGV
jgi:NAD(P)-dependent dehydrogenase (short-subunit alcohol dehydrogenase family)